MDNNFIIDYHNPESGEILNYNFEYGNAYIFFVDKPGVQKDIFSRSTEQISFINSFFDGAIKVPTYFKKNRKQLLKNKDVMNASGIFPFELEEHDLIDRFLLVLFAELLKAKIAIIETVGLTEFSIIKLIKYSSLYLEQNPDKLIILADNNYSDMNIKMILKIDKCNIDKHLNEWIPYTSKHNKIIFKLD